MGFCKAFYFPWLELEGDDPDDTRLADLDSKNNQQQQPDANLAQELIDRAYPSGGRIIRNMPEAPAMQPYDMGGLRVRDAALSAVQIGTLTSALANATPEMQRLVYVPIWFSNNRSTPVPRFKFCARILK
jgi:hypothetical protein